MEPATRVSICPLFKKKMPAEVNARSETQYTETVLMESNPCERWATHMIGSTQVWKVSYEKDGKGQCQVSDSPQDEPQRSIRAFIGQDDQCHDHGSHGFYPSLE